MSLETLLLIVAFVVAGVFNVILPWLKKIKEDALAGNAEPEPQLAPTAVLTPVLSASSAPASAFATPRGAPTMTAASMASAVARPARRSPVGSRSGLRDGIVLAAVLGPCRAQTPFV